MIFNLVCLGLFFHTGSDLLLDRSQQLKQARTDGAIVTTIKECAEDMNEAYKIFIDELAASDKWLYCMLEEEAASLFLTRSQGTVANRSKRPISTSGAWSEDPEVESQAEIQKIFLKNCVLVQPIAYQPIRS